MGVFSYHRFAEAPISCILLEEPRVSSPASIQSLALQW
nr:MAG TPA: hypothetical protein [Caudoviricetes sp.]